MLNFCVRVVCLLTASLMATHALAQDLSGWSDKTVCRLVKSDGGAAYVAESDNRGLNCNNRIIELTEKGIRKLQELLNELDYDLSPIDGILSPENKIALEHVLVKFGRLYPEKVTNKTLNVLKQIKDKIKNSNSRVYNDFSKVIYKSGITIQPSGPHPKAASLNDGILSITITPKMTAVNRKYINRFEIGKRNMAQNSATMLKFKVRSDNEVIDRVLIAQIKHWHSKSKTGPQASVNIDRPPTCSSWSVSKNLPLRLDGQKTLLRGRLDKYKEDLYQYNWKDGKHNGLHNKSYIPLNDGKWHEVEMHVYPHTSKGFCRIYIDGILYINLQNASTKTTLTKPHGHYDARIGIYRDKVDYNQTVEFDDYEVVNYQPLDTELESSRQTPASAECMIMGDNGICLH
jgi:hypothetical protein